MSRTLRLLVLGLILLAFAVNHANAQRRRGRGRLRRDNSPKVGDLAPDFELATLESLLKDGSSKKKVKLSSFRGKKPVVFVLTSYT